MIANGASDFIRRLRKILASTDEEIVKNCEVKFEVQTKVECVKNKKGRAGCARTACRDAGAPTKGSPTKGAPINEIALLSPEDVSSAISESYDPPE